MKCRKTDPGVGTYNKNGTVVISAVFNVRELFQFDLSMKGLNLDLNRFICTDRYQES